MRLTQVLLVLSIIRGPLSAETASVFKFSQDFSIVVGRLIVSVTQLLQGIMPLNEGQHWLRARGGAQNCHLISLISTKHRSIIHR